MSKGLTQEELHQQIKELVRLEIKENHESYNKEIPYQSYERINFKGLRWTPERRIKEYGIADYLNKESRVLDIGSNCGFLTCELALTAKIVHGVEPNLYLNKIGELTARYLGVADKVKFFNEYFLSFNSEIKYDIILSLAAFHTADGQEREKEEDYFGRVNRLLCPKGIIFYESVSYDSSKKDSLYKVIQSSVKIMKRIFQTIDCSTRKSGSPGWFREYFIGEKT